MRNNHTSWISTYGITLAIVACRFPGRWCWFTLGVLSLAIIPKRSRAIYLGLGLLAALHCLYLDHKQDPVPITSPNSGYGVVQSEQRSSKGCRWILRDNRGWSLLIRNQGNPVVWPGDSIYWQANWDPLEPCTIPGSFDTPAWLAQQGCAGSGALVTASLIGHHFSIEGWAFGMREKLRALCLRYLSIQSAGILQALLVGDKSGIDSDVNQDFRDTGLIHILTVSGFHVVFLSAFFLLFLKAVRLPDLWARLITLFLLLALIPITGASPSVQRAVLMFFLLEAAKALERTPLSLHALGLAASLLLLWDPSSLTDVGFQLSCAATAGILLGNPLRPAWVNRCPALLRTWVVEPSLVTLYASAGTFPLLVLHFQSFSPVSFIGNLAVVPLMGLAMEAGLFLLLSAPIPWLATGFGQAASWLIGISLRATHICTTLPGTGITVGPWPWWICFWILGSLCAIPSALRHQRSAQWIALSGLAAWCLWGFALPHNMRVDMLDAGQGDATLLLFPNGKSILIDAGNGEHQGKFGERSLRPFLRLQGIEELDALVITHPDMDHFGGGKSLLTSFRIKALWISEATRVCDKPAWEQFLQTAHAQGIPIFSLKTGMQALGTGNWHLQVRWAPKNMEQNDWNNTSAVLALSGPQGNEALFMGDLGIEGERIILQDSSLHDFPILKLGHHGSKNSSTVEFLTRIHPKLALISAGRDNRYGHPSPIILDRLDSIGCGRLSTQQAGTIHIQWDLQPRRQDSGSPVTSMTNWEARCSQNPDCGSSWKRVVKSANALTASDTLSNASNTLIKYVWAWSKRLVE